MCETRRITLVLALVGFLGVPSAHAASWSKWQRLRWAYWSGSNPRTFWVNPEWLAAGSARQHGIAAYSIDRPLVPNPNYAPVPETGLEPPSFPTPPAISVAPAIFEPTPAPVFSAEPPRIDLGEFVVPQNEADAYLNMGDGDYPQAATLTSGSARPWYESQVVSRVFGGTPDSVERAAFTQTVVDRVQATYEKSGIALSLTADPAVSAAHTLSVVSGAQSPMNPDAIGVSDMGRNGFGFIDKLDYAQSVDELAWAVARNVSHELMHTFGTVHHDQTGSYLDAAVTPWELLVDPETTFSSEAVADLLAKDFRTTGAGGTGLFTAALMVDHSKSCDCGSCTGLSVSPIPVPELGALFIWSLGGLAVMETQRRRRSHRG